MKILKYIKDNANYCLVQKTNVYIHYLLKKNNQIYYYFSLGSKNYHKTNKICKKLLSHNDLKIELHIYDTYELINAYNESINSSDYHVIINPYGEENFDIVRIYKKNNLFLSFKDMNKSPIFANSYIFYLFNYKHNATFHGFFINHYLKFYKKHKKHKLIVRYYLYLTKLFINLNIKIQSNFETLLHSNSLFKDKYLFLLYAEFDKIIKIDKNKILKKFDISSEEELYGYLYYYNNYLYYFYYQYYCNLIKDEKANISITACAFNTPVIYEKVKNIMKNENVNLIKLNFKKYILFFIEKELENYLYLVDQKHKIESKKYLIKHE